MPLRPKLLRVLSIQDVIGSPPIANTWRCWTQFSNDFSVSTCILWARVTNLRSKARLCTLHEGSVVVVWLFLERSRWADYDSPWILSSVLKAIDDSALKKMINHFSPCSQCQALRREESSRSIPPLGRVKMAWIFLASNLLLSHWLIKISWLSDLVDPAIFHGSAKAEEN